MPALFMKVAPMMTVTRSWVCRAHADRGVAVTREYGCGKQRLLRCWGWGWGRSTPMHKKTCSSSTGCGVEKRVVPSCD